MAKHLTDRDIGIIINQIDSVRDKLTWNGLCDAVEPLIGTRPTRQTLNAHERIKTAFALKKDLLRDGFHPSKRPASLAIAEQRIRRLESENERLRRENELLLQRFVVWQYNAYKNGMTPAKLDAPLPVIDRDSSEQKG
ncbi:hypothetical protein [Crenobacter caeni]|uniref:Uncharacterized protein n=1 Tax=Crenobacter caeni TaxID=2705474 RepID=A0A6B2KRY0_9NEIS|nr:hypothetical protein [Crenobacter caeni]NDV13002.1 hypothetical protein [Crenobacter caeni]